MPAIRRDPKHGPRLGLYRPDSAGPGPTWRINGHRARLLVWTVEEWERLEDRPPDAQYHERGFWCALRLD